VPDADNGEQLMNGIAWTQGLIGAVSLRKAALIAAAVVGGTLVLNGCAVNVADDADIAASPTAPSTAGATPDPTVCTDMSYHPSETSVDMSIYNGTDQVLTMVPDLTFHTDGGPNEDAHWDKRPPETLQPGECAEVTAYNNNGDGDTMGLTINATYTMPDGTYVPFSVEQVSARGVGFNPTVFAPSPVPSFNEENDANGSNGWKGTPVGSFVILNSDDVGVSHVHAALKLVPAP
jgi:hypothetical protein